MARRPCSVFLPFVPIRLTTRSQIIAALMHGAPCDCVGRRSNKYEAGRSGQLHVGMPVAADKNQSGAAIADSEVSQFSAISRYGFHRDVEKFAERLVEVTQTQRRANFGRTQFKSERSGSCIDIAKRSLDSWAKLNVVTRRPVAKAKVESRKDHEVQFKGLFVEWKCRTTQNFIGLIANPDRTRRRVHCCTNGVDAFRATNRDGFPNRDFNGDRRRQLPCRIDNGRTRGRGICALGLRLRRSVPRVKRNRKYYQEAAHAPPSTRAQHCSPLVLAIQAIRTVPSHRR